MNRLKDEYERSSDSNPLKGLSQKTSLLYIKLKNDDDDDDDDHHHKIGYFKAYTFMNLSVIFQFFKNRHFYNFTLFLSFYNFSFSFSYSNNKSKHSLYHYQFFNFESDRTKMTTMMY